MRVTNLMKEFNELVAIFLQVEHLFVYVALN